MQPFIQHQFASVVWRLEIDSLSDTIFIEVRNQSDKQVSFSAIGLNNGKVYFDQLQTEERWLTGIETAYSGVLLLHNYQSEAGPNHKGIIAIDGSTGNNIWNNYTHAFDHLSVNGPVIYDTRLQPRKLLLADISTGQLLRSYEPVIDTEPVSYIRVPDMVPANLVQVPVAPYGNAIHYLEHNSLRIVSLHSLVEGTLEQRLYILDNNGLVYEDLLNSGIQKLQPEAFLMHRDQLIYLKNKSELKILNL